MIKQQAIQEKSQVFMEVAVFSPFLAGCPSTFLTTLLTTHKHPSNFTRVLLYVNTQFKTYRQCSLEKMSKFCQCAGCGQWFTEENAEIGGRLTTKKCQDEHEGPFNRIATTAPTAGKY